MTDTVSQGALGEEQATLVEAIARRVVELLSTPSASTPGVLVLGVAMTVDSFPVGHDTRAVRLVDAAEMARVLNVSVDFVYEHAAELGAIPLSEGERPRLRFDVQRAIEGLTARSAGARSLEPAERSAPPLQRGRPRGRAGTGGDLLPIRGRLVA